MESFPYKRMVVIGATSSGKSTLANRIAEKLSLGFIEKRRRQGAKFFVFLRPGNFALNL